MSNGWAVGDPNGHGCRKVPQGILASQILLDFCQDSQEEDDNAHKQSTARHYAQLSLTYVPDSMAGLHRANNRLSKS